MHNALNIRVARDILGFRLGFGGCGLCFEGHGLGLGLGVAALLTSLVLAKVFVAFVIINTVLTSR